MLTISVVRNIDYYTDLSAEDYYASGSEPEGSWEGKGSTLLGLSGKVEVAVYRKVLEGLSPNGDEKLVANPGEGHRPGWDLTFSAPKSVSLMWAGSSEPVRESISKLHHKAVRSAIKLLEDEAAETRRGADGVKREKTVGLTAITFEHCVSRALDPQLHTHCLIANVAPRYDGSWGTIESRNLYQWQRAAGAAYRAELAFGLTSLGIEIELQDDAFRVSKIPESVCEEFSKRSAVIREALKKYGGIRSGSKLGDLISLYTREKKTTYERADLLKDWQARLSQFGLTPDHLGSTDPQFVKSRLSIDSGKQALTSNMLESLTEQKTVFRKQDVFQACFKLALSQRLSAKEAASIAFDALSHAHTVSLGLDERNNQVFTTFRALQEEQEMLESAKSLSSQKHFGVDDELVALSMSRQSIQLSEEQIEGIWSVCGQTSLAILQGSAGAGKSASMKCVREVYERSGFKVLGGAVAKLAADNLNRETGITSHTVAKILSDLDAGRFEFNEKVVLIVDEAGQLGVSQLARLLAEAEKASSKIVLVGEDKQLDSIQQGGSLRYLSRSDIIGASRVETIRRQREE
ncbi:MAG: MobF family relaxase, partial [Cyclobacteriaceae bacterium]